MLSTISAFIFIFLYLIVRLILPVVLLFALGKLAERYKSEAVM